jgi:hypothetical protein
MSPKKIGRSLVPCSKRALVEKWKALAWLEGQIMLKDMPSNYTRKFLVSPVMKTNKVTHIKTCTQSSISFVLFVLWA